MRINCLLMRRLFLEAFNGNIEKSYPKWTFIHFPYENRIVGLGMKKLQGLLKIHRACVTFESGKPLLLTRLRSTPSCTYQTMNNLLGTSKNKRVTFVSQMLIYWNEIFWYVMQTRRVFSYYWWTHHNTGWILGGNAVKCAYCVKNVGFASINCKKIYGL